MNSVAGREGSALRTGLGLNGLALGVRDGLALTGLSPPVLALGGLLIHRIGRRCVFAIGTNAQQLKDGFKFFG